MTIRSASLDRFAAKRFDQHPVQDRVRGIDAQSGFHVPQLGIGRRRQFSDIRSDVALRCGGRRFDHLKDEESRRVLASQRRRTPQRGLRFLAAVVTTQDGFVGHVRTVILKDAAHAGPDGCVDVVQRLCSDGTEKEPANHSAAMGRHHYQIRTLVFRNAADRLRRVAALQEDIDVLAGKGLGSEFP